MRSKLGYSYARSQPSLNPSRICPLSNGPYYMQFIVCLSIKDMSFNFSISFVCRLKTMMHFYCVRSPTSTWPTRITFGASKTYRCLPKACGSLLLRPVHFSTGTVIKSNEVSLIFGEIFSKMSFCKVKVSTCLPLI